MPISNCHGRFAMASPEGLVGGLHRRGACDGDDDGDSGRASYHIAPARAPREAVVDVIQDY
jgi:hypothetical protein